jgi:hypothetical protein
MNRKGQKAVRNKGYHKIKGKLGKEIFQFQACEGGGGGASPEPAGLASSTMSLTAHSKKRYGLDTSVAPPRFLCAGVVEGAPPPADEGASPALL